MGWISLKRFQKYFDVDTKDVLWRLTNSVTGAIRGNFLATTENSPDLYGPFWIATTLVFLTAVVSNLVSYFNHIKDENNDDDKDKEEDDEEEWGADYTKLGAAAGMYYGYVFVIGLLLWLLLYCMKSDMKLSQVWCIYGYSLTMYLPISLFTMVNVSWIKGLLIAFGVIFSGTFLIMNFREAIYTAAPARAIVIMVAMAIFDIFLGLMLFFYFGGGF